MSTAKTAPDFARAETAEMDWPQQICSRGSLYRQPLQQKLLPVFLPQQILLWIFETA